MVSDSFLVVVEWAEENYSAYLPDLPGCVATGVSVDDALENIRTLFQEYSSASPSFTTQLPIHPAVGAYISPGASSTRRALPSELE